MRDVDQVLARCTRNGVILWPHVARQLGISEADARARHDPTYDRPYAAAPPRRKVLPEPQEPSRPPNSRGRPNVEAIRADLVRVLDKGPLSAGDIEARLPWPRGTLQNHLRLMRDAGKLQHFQRERLWGLPVDPQR